MAVAAGKTKVCVTLPDNVADRLDELTKVLGVNRSGVVALAVQRFDDKAVIQQRGKEDGKGV